MWDMPPSVLLPKVIRGSAPKKKEPLSVEDEEMPEALLLTNEANLIPKAEAEENEDIDLSDEDIELDDAASQEMQKNSQKGVR